MGNRKGGNRKGKHDIAPAMRASFLSALQIYRKRHGKTLPEALADWMEEKPIEVINAMAKFTVRETKVEGSVEHKHQHTHESVSETTEWIEGMLRTSEKGEAQEPSEARSVLPAKVSAKPTRH